MIKIIRTNAEHKDFVKLVHSLNEYLKVIDGTDHAFYNQYNGLENLKHVIILYLNNTPAACGSFKFFDKNTAEIKRMYTVPEFRGQGLAFKILQELEKWAMEEGFKSCVLETGKRQDQAVSLYHRMQYILTPNFGPYKTMSNSICFKKEFTQNEKR